MKTLEQLLNLSNISIKKGLNNRNQLEYLLFHEGNLKGKYPTKKETNLNAIFLLDSLTIKIL